jgi:hypothetical protein
VEQVVDLGMGESGFDESQADCRLLDALAEVALVEGEA